MPKDPTLDVQARAQREREALTRSLGGRPATRTAAASQPGEFDDLIPPAGRTGQLAAAATGARSVVDERAIPPLPPGFKLDDPFGDLIPRTPEQAVADYDQRTTLLGRLGNDLRRGFTLRGIGEAIRQATAVDPQALLDGLAASAATSAGMVGTTLPDTSRQAATLKQDATRALADGIAELAAMPQRPVTQQIGEARSFGEAFDALKRDPLGAIAGFGAQSAPLSIESLLLAPALGPLAPIGIGAQSANNELRLGMFEFITSDLAKRGLDPRDPDVLMDALADERLVGAAREFAAKRAAIIGPVDAATAAIGGKLLVPRAIPGAVTREVLNATVAQPAVQATGGAGAEAVAQLATTGRVGAPGEVLAEALGEAFTAPVEVAAVGGRAAAERVRAQRAAANTATPPAAAPAQAPAAARPPAAAAPAPRAATAAAPTVAPATPAPTAAPEPAPASPAVPRDTAAAQPAPRPQAAPGDTQPPPDTAPVSQPTVAPQVRFSEPTYSDGMDVIVAEPERAGAGTSVDAPTAAEPPRVRLEREVGSNRWRVVAPDGAVAGEQLTLMEAKAQAVRVIEAARSSPAVQPAPALSAGAEAPAAAAVPLTAGRPIVGAPASRAAPAGSPAALPLTGAAPASPGNVQTVGTAPQLRFRTGGATTPAAARTSSGPIATSATGTAEQPPQPAGRMPPLSQPAPSDRTDGPATREAGAPADDAEAEQPRVADAPSADGAPTAGGAPEADAALGEPPGSRTAGPGTRGAERQAGARTARAGEPAERGTRVSNRALARSPFEQAFRDAGMEPDDAVLLAPKDQLATLQKLTVDRFGFKEIRLDKSLSAREAIDNLLDLYQNGRAMLAVMGLPFDALSGGGRITLSLYNRNPQGNVPSTALAFYADGIELLAVKRRHSAFAHEWFHALDYALLRKYVLAGRGASGALAATATGADARSKMDDRVGRAFYDVMLAMYKNPELPLQLRALELSLEEARAKGDAKAVKRLEAQHAKLTSLFTQRDSAYYSKLKGLDDYWKRPTEMFARAGEAYVAARVEESVGEVDPTLTPAEREQASAFLGNADRTYRDESVRAIAAVYPLEERMRLFQAFDELFAAMRDAGMLGAADGNAVPMPNDYGPLDPTRWNAIAGKSQATTARKVFAAELKGLREMRVQLTRFYRSIGKGLTSPEKLQALRLLGSMSWRSQGAVLEIFRRRYSDNQHLTWLVDQLTYEPGSRRRVGQVFEEARKQELRRFANRLNHVFQAHGLAELDEAGWKSIRDMLAVPNESSWRAPANLKSAAGEIRRLLDDVYYHATNAGIDLGYAKAGYFPRVPNLERILADQEGFMRDAARLYELIQEREAELAADALLAHIALKLGDSPLVDEIRAALDDVRAALAARDKAALTAAREALTALLGQVQPRGATVADEQKFTKTLAALRQELNGVVGRDPAAQAEAWYKALAYGGMFDFDTAGPQTAFARSRTLPPEADSIMAAWLLTNPVDVLPGYLAAVVNRAEFARRFGKDGERLTEAFNGLRDSRIPPEHVEVIVEHVNMLLGRHGRTLPRGLRAKFAWIETLQTMALLKLALITNLAEVGSIAVRTANGADLPLSLKVWGELTASRLANLVTGVELSQRARAAEELAEFFGLVSSHTLEALANARYMANLEIVSPKLQRLSANYYRRIGLHAVTSAQRKTAMIVGWRYFHRLADKVLDGTPAERSAAGAMFRALGVADEKHVPLAELVRSTGELPTVDQVQGSGLMAETATALNRFVNEAIQDPSKFDRSYLANLNMPLLSGVFGLLSFAYAFARNLIFGTYRRGVAIAQAGGTGEGAIYFGGIAFAFALSFGTHMLVTMARESTLNRERWKRDFHDKDGELEWEKVVTLTFSRMGLTGGADPFYNYLTNRRYESSVANVIVGPVWGSIGQSVDRLAQPLGRNSPGTVNAEWNAARGAYDLILGPALSYAIGATPAGPLVGFGLTAAAVSAQTGTVRNEVLDAAVGERTQRQPKAERSTY